jgi:GR25 family glycosyltransferase involved in LPS biosynthesis
MASGASHILVCEDDVILCDDFCNVLAKALSTRSAHIVELFASGGGPFDPLFAASEKPVPGQFFPNSWIDQDVHCCGPAMLMPREFVIEYCAWQAANISLHCQHIDDLFIRLWARCTKRKIALTAPSLVQHDHTMLSTCGNQPNKEAQAYRFAGADAGKILWTSTGLDWPSTDIRPNTVNFSGQTRRH